MARVLAAMSLLLFAACDLDPDLFVRQQWPTDHTVIAVATDPSGVVIYGPDVFEGVEPLNLSVPRQTPFLLFVQTYAPSTLAANGAPIATCDIAVGGPGRRLPEPDTAWATPLLGWFIPNEVEFTREPRAERTDLNLRSKTCIAPERGCADYVARVVDLPAELRPLQVAPISDDVVFIGGDVHPGPGRQTMIARIEGDEVHILPPSPDVSGWTRGLVWDHGGLLYGVDEGFEVFMMDLRGRPMPLRRLVRAHGIRSGRDGTILAFDERHTVQLVSNGDVIVERTDMPNRVQHLDVGRSDRIIAGTDLQTVHAYDGVGWADEITFDQPEKLRGVAIDDEMMVAVGTLETVIVKTAGDSEWTRIQPPLGAGIDFNDVTMLAGGRFVAVGDSGAIEAWTGAEWCDLDVGLQGQFEVVEVAPSGLVAWAILNDSPDRRLVRIEVPAPLVP